MIPPTTETKARIIAERIVRTIRERESTDHPENDWDPTDNEKVITIILSGIIKKELDYFEEVQRELANGEEIGV